MLYRLRVLLATCAVVCASPSHAQARPSPYVDEVVFIKAKLKELHDAMRELARERLNLAYPIILRRKEFMQDLYRGEFKQLSTRPGFSKLQDDGRTLYLTVNWSNVSFEITTPNPSKYTFDLSDVTAEFQGYEDSPKPAAHYVTYWNCSAQAVTMKVTNDQEKETTTTDSETRRSMLEKSLTITVKYEGAIKKAEAAWSKKVTDEFTRSKTVTQRDLSREGLAYDVTIDKYSARQFGGTADSRVQKWTALGRMIVDLPLYAQVTTPGGPPRRFFVGNWSEFYGPEHRSLEIRAVVRVPTTNRNTSVGTPRVFKDEEECKKVKAAASNAGDDPFSKEFVAPDSMKLPTTTDKAPWGDAGAFIALKAAGKQVVTKAECKATAVGKAKLGNGGEVALSFDVSVDSCPIKDFAHTTGKINYKLHAKDSQGKPVVLPGPTELWASEPGKKFTKTSKWRVRDGSVTEVSDAIEDERCCRRPKTEPLLRTVPA